MEIVAAEPAGDVHRLADGVEAGHPLGFHRLGGQFGGRNAADGDLGLGEALAAIGMELPLGEPLLRRAQDLVGDIAELGLDRELVGEDIGKPRSQQIAQGRAYGTARIAALAFDQPVAALLGQEIDRHRIAGPPIGRGLEDRRPRQAAMGKQRGFGKAGLSGTRDHRGGHARNLAKQHFVTAQRQRDEGGARLDHFEPELAGQIVGETGRAHLGNRRAAGGDHEGVGAIGCAGRGDFEPIAMRDLAHIGIAEDFDISLRAFGEQQIDDLLRRPVAE